MGCQRSSSFTFASRLGILVVFQVVYYVLYRDKADFTPYVDVMSFDFTIADEKGTPLCDISGLSVSKHRALKKASIERRYDIKIEKLPVKAIPKILSLAPLPEPSATIVHYARGEEMQIKAKLLSLDRYQRLDVWFLSGNDTNGAAARGLTRSLRREIPTWRIRLVLFPVTSSTKYRVSILHLIHERVPSEDEIELDEDGHILVPRMVESPAPRSLETGVLPKKPELRFDSDRVYLLLGGIGSLGVRIALWMYEVCRTI